MTRRLRRERWGCRPEGGSTFFRSERKYQRKPAARRLREKALLLPILTAGLATSRAMELESYLLRLCALLCSPFSAVKMGGPFSLRCLSPLCSPAVGVGQTQPMRVGILHCSLGGFAAQKNRLDFFPLRLALCLLNQRRLGCFAASLDILATQKASVVSNPRWPFYASHEACRRMAVFSIQLTGKHTRPASREACRRAAVKPRPTRMSLYAPARIARSPKKGAQPLKSSASWTGGSKSSAMPV